MTVGKITIEQIGPALILSDATDYIIKELENQNIFRSVLIELEPKRKCPFIITHPLLDNTTVVAAYDGIKKYISKSDEDFKAI